MTPPSAQQGSIPDRTEVSHCLWLFCSALFPQQSGLLPRVEQPLVWSAKAAVLHALVSPTLLYLFGIFSTQEAEAVCQDAQQLSL